MDKVETIHTNLKDIYIELCKKDEIDTYDVVSIFQKNNNYLIGWENNTKLKNDIEVTFKDGFIRAKVEDKNEQRKF